MRNIYYFCIACVCALSGCASSPSDWGAGEVDALLAERGHVVSNQNAHQGSAKSLAGPLTLDQALSLALNNSPTIRAAYSELGYGVAEVYEGNRIRNPILSLSLLEPTNAGGVSRFSYGFLASLTDLITLPARKEFAEAEFRALQADVAATIFNVVADAEYAYFDYATSYHLVQVRQRISQAARIAATLGQQFFDAGNLPLKTLATLKATAAAAEAALHSQQAEAEKARSALANLLGVSANSSWQVASQITRPVVMVDDLQSLLSLTEDSRLDLRAAKNRLHVLGARHGFVTKARWLGQLNVGAERERESDGEKLLGANLEWSLPIFNQGLDRQLRADATFQVAEANLRLLALNIENEVRAQRTALATASNRVALLGETLIPALIVATEQAQKEQHYMLIGVFELLEVKQREYLGIVSYFSALRAYWLARASLARAVGRVLPTVEPVEYEEVNLAAFIQRTSADSNAAHAHQKHRAENSPKTTEALR